MSVLDRWSKREKIFPRRKWFTRDSDKDEIDNTENNNDEKTIDEQQDEMVQSFLSGLSQSLNIPIENFDNKEMLIWIIEFGRSFLTEDQYKLTVAPSNDKLIEFGKKFAEIIQSAVKRLPDDIEPTKPTADTKDIDNQIGSQQQLLQTPKPIKAHKKSTIAVDM